MPADEPGLADPKARQEDQPVPGRDEGGQVLEPVGVGAEHDRAEHLGAGRHNDHQERAGAVLAVERGTRSDQDRPGRRAQQELLVRVGEVVERQEPGDHAGDHRRKRQWRGQWVAGGLSPHGASDCTTLDDPAPDCDDWITLAGRVSTAKLRP